MKVDIDIGIINNTETCKFGNKCLEEFDTSLCCDILTEGSNYLFVSPVSTFKSSNCSYIREVRQDDRQAYICTCPLRLEIFRKYNL